MHNRKTAENVSPMCNTTSEFGKAQYMPNPAGRRCKPAFSDAQHKLQW